LYLKSEWHTAFDAGKWILLPDAATLVEVHCYVQSALAWRVDPSSDRVQHFTTQVWEETEREKRRKGKRKREENDTDTYSLTTSRTTRSQSRSANGGHDGPSCPSQSGSCACTQPGGSDTHKRSTRVANKRKRKLGSADRDSNAASPNGRRLRI